MFRIARVLSSSTLVRTTLSTRTYVSGAPADGISVTVCGGGNAAHVAAGMYSRAGAKVNMFFSFEEEARKFREGHSGAITVENFECSTAAENLGITVKLANEEYTAPILGNISHKAEDVIPGSDMVKCRSQPTILKAISRF